MQAEKQLIDALKEGSEQAFNTFVLNYQGKVINTCLGFAPNIQDAEDIAQEVFVEVYRSIGKFKEQSSLSTWVYRIAVSKSLEFIRHRKRKKRASFFQSLIGLEDERASAVSDTFNHPGVQMENKQRGEVIFAAINELAENQKIAFILSKVEGLSYQEIASIMELSISSIESLLHRAKKNLQKKLETYYKKQMI